MQCGLFVTAGARPAVQAGRAGAARGRGARGGAGAGRAAGSGPRAGRRAAGRAAAGARRGAARGPGARGGAPGRLRWRRPSRYRGCCANPYEEDEAEEEKEEEEEEEQAEEFDTNSTQMRHKFGANSLATRHNSTTLAQIRHNLDTHSTQTVEFDQK